MGDRIGLEVHGPGLIDCHLYRQSGRLILHLVNLINEGTWRGPLDELIPVGPIQVKVKVPKDVHARDMQALVSRIKPVMAVRQGWASFEVKIDSGSRGDRDRVVQHCARAQVA